MTGTVVVQMPEEKDLGEVVQEKTITQEALEVLQVATVIAEKLDDAGDDDEGVILVLERLGNIESSLSALFVRLDGIVELLQKPVEPIVVVEEEEEEEEETAPDVVIEAEDESTVVIPAEEVPVAITPQIKKKKARRWL